MSSNQNQALTVEVGQADFEAQVINSKQPVLVAFGAPWSRPCGILKGQLEDVAAMCANNGVRVVRINADDNPELSLWYDVGSIPTLLFFVAGHVRARLVGTASQEAIAAKWRMVLGAEPTRPPTT